MLFVSLSSLKNEGAHMKKTNTDDEYQALPFDLNTEGFAKILQTIIQFFTQTKTKQHLK